MTVLPTLAFKRVDDLLVVVHSTETPSDADWDCLMQEPLQQFKGTLVVAGTTKLDARKRRMLADRVKHTELKVAVLVSSSVARGIVTALGWLVGGYRAFEMNEIEKAATYIGIPQLRCAEVERVVRDLQAQLRTSTAKASNR